MPSWSRLSIDYMAIAALATLATAIIMLIAYLKQSKLFNLQIRHYEGSQLERLRHHYRDVATELQKLINTNEATINQSMEKIYNDWHSLKMQYSTVGLLNDLTFHDGLAHIEKDIPDFRLTVNEFSKRVNTLNISIDSLRGSKVERVKKKLSLCNFKLTGDPPYIMEKIEDYWFKDMLTPYTKDKKSIQEIRNNLKPLRNTPTKKGKFNVTQDNGYLYFSSHGMCIAPADEQRFLSEVMELITDERTWFEIYDIITQRKHIAEDLALFNKAIVTVIQNIYQNNYNQTFECCKPWIH